MFNNMKHSLTNRVATLRRFVLGVTALPSKLFKSFKKSKPAPVEIDMSYAAQLGRRRALQIEPYLPSK